MEINHLKLTGVIQIPSEIGQEKIDQTLKNLNSKSSTYRDEYGRSAEDYEDLNIPLPKDFYKEDTVSPLDIDEDGYVKLMPEDFSDAYVEVRMPVESIDFYMGTSKSGSIIYTKAGNSVFVKEQIQDIENLIINL
jgi:hypothetical protein